jgi:effector-binding domain-containing protein
MGVGGVYREASPPERTVHTERFDEAWYPGESVITTTFAEEGGRTRVTMTILYVSREARDGVLKSPMEGGVRQSYDRLAEILDGPQVLRTAAMPIATLHVTVPRSEIQKVMGPGLAELKAAVAAQGVAVTGPWFTHHLKMDPAVFDFEIGVPVAKPISPAGRVRPGTWPAARIARTVHRGGYEKLGDAWGAFNQWAEAQGLRPAEDLWERYVTGPESGPDPGAYRTELIRPLKG